MRNNFGDFLVQLKGIWGRLDGGQRLVVAAVLAATLVGLGGMVWYAGQPSYEVVGRFTTAEDISTMEQALQRANIAFVVDDGTTFKVERSKVGMAQMAMNKAGLTSKADPVIGGPSTMMDDAQTKAFKLAQASVAIAQDTILEMAGVAGVKITANKSTRPSAYRDSAALQKPTATVVLRLQQGASFLDIAKAASSVTASQLGIPEANVTVVSANGTQRYRFDPDRDTGGGSSEFLAMQRSLAEEKSRLAQERLDQMWPGKTSVAVTIDLDPNWEVTTQRVLPPEPLISSEKTTKDNTEKTQGKTADPAGASTEAANKDTDKKETKDRTYVTDIGERRSGKMAPEIKRMTVAIIYDRSLEKVEGWNQEDLKKSVKSIVGWDKRRDSEDDFSTLAGDFQPLDLANALDAGPGLADVALRWGPTIGQILGVLVVVMFLRGLFKRGTRLAAAGVGAGGASGGGGGGGEAKQPSIEEQQRQMRREIEKSIASDPAALAKLLESWLTEQKA